MRSHALKLVHLVVALVSLAASRPPVFKPESFNMPDVRRVTSAEIERLQTPDVVLDVPTARPHGGEPAQIGIVRTFATPFSGSVGAFRSTGAGRVRLHLTAIDAPPNARFTVAGANGEAISFGRDLQGPGGDLWTPSVEGDAIVISAPAGARFAVSALGHVFDVAPTSTGCFNDASCAPSSPERDELSAAVAQLTYSKNGGLYVCTGGLINGAAGDHLLLTANHCISTQESASSLELAWDLRTASCGSTSTPNTKRTNGSTLVATSSTSDVTLLRLNSVPSGRWLLGWTTQRPTSGTELYRISHPYDDTLGLFPQQWSTTVDNETTTACSSVNRPNFLYSLRDSGGIAGGSSGSPVIVQGGYIVGQLYGLCGPDPIDGCSSTSKLVDGSLAQSYAVLQPYINPTPSGSCSCTPSATTACMLGGRFKVTLTWRDTGANLSGNGSLVKYAENVAEVDPSFGPVSESAFFSLYSFAPNSVEVLVRILNGHGINDKFWVFLTGFTGAEYTVTVQDTKTCASWTRTVTAGSTNVVKDFSAFPLP